ncbi:MAG: hypothetical protein WC445_02740 [Patescibacteria group bacterium]
MVTINIKLDIKKDAWNWWNACNKISHGVDWKQRVGESLWKKIYGKTEKEAFKFLIPYLKKYYKEHKKVLEKNLAEAQKLFDDNAQEACSLMEKITGKQLYRKKFTCFLTTFPRCPYNYEKGYVWLCAVWSAKCYLGTFLHELLHFQFIAYCKNKQPVKNLSPRQFEYLKESLTVILNYEFKKYLCQKDKGYDLHQAFRKKLEILWQKNKNFNQLVKYGVEVLTT